VEQAEHVLGGREERGEEESGREGRHFLLVLLCGLRYLQLGISLAPMENRNWEQVTEAFIKPQGGEAFMQLGGEASH